MSMKVCFGALCTKLNLFGAPGLEETFEAVKEAAAAAPTIRWQQLRSGMNDWWPCSVPISAILLLVLAWFLAFCTDRIVSLLLDLTLLIQSHTTAATPAPSCKSSPKRTKLFHKTNQVSLFLVGLTRSLTIAARVYLGLLLVQWVVDRIPVSTVWHRVTAPFASTPFCLRDSALNLSIIIWAALTLAAVKRYFIFHCVPCRRLGRLTLLDRILDIAIFFGLLLAILSELSIDSTLIVQAVLSAGGVGALIFSLASKDLATEIVGGVALNIWNAIDVGERIRLDTISGKVIEIGLVETLIQGYDNIITRIPNSQLTKSRFSNLSRTPRSRLRQYLRFQHADIDKLPTLLDDIKDEIKLACPKLVSDGTKSFHAVLTSFEADHIQVMILAHFDISPATGEFTRNRHAVMFAIARAMAKHNVQFAIPSMVYSVIPNATSTATVSVESQVVPCGAGTHMDDALGDD